MAARIPPAQQRAIVVRYCQGFSCREVGKQFGVSLQTVANIIEALAPDKKRKPHYGMGETPAHRLELAKEMVAS